jgi:hypothetical protein
MKFPMEAGTLQFRAEQAVHDRHGSAFLVAELARAAKIAA